MADVLTTSSRNFYERTRGKVVVSLVLGSASLMLLGFCSYSGGTAANFQSGMLAPTALVGVAFGPRDLCLTSEKRGKSSKFCTGIAVPRHIRTLFQ